MQGNYYSINHGFGLHILGKINIYIGSISYVQYVVLCGSGSVRHAMLLFLRSVYNYKSSMGSAVDFSRRYLDDHLTHFSAFPEAHKTASHILSGPTLPSSGKSKGVSCLYIFLNKMYCSPSLQADTICGWWLLDLLLTPALASPTTSLGNPGCKTQQCVPCLRGFCAKQLAG